MLNLKSKVSEKQPFRCIFCQMGEEITQTTMRQEFKNDQGFEVKLPFCNKHSDLTPEAIIDVLKKAFTPPEDPQMEFEDEDEDGSYAPKDEPEETKAVAVRGRKR